MRFSLYRWHLHDGTPWRSSLFGRQPYRIVHIIHRRRFPWLRYLPHLEPGCHLWRGLPLSPAWCSPRALIRPARLTHRRIRRKLTHGILMALEPFDFTALELTRHLRSLGLPVDRRDVLPRLLLLALLGRVVPELALGGALVWRVSARGRRRLGVAVLS